MKKTLALLLAALALSGCGASDKPPSDGTPEPEPLNGVYQADCGTLTFNGDGRSVTVDTDKSFEELCGVPAGEHDGTYVFLFHNEEWRRDKAEYFRITIDGESYQMQNRFGPAEDEKVAVTAGGQDIDFTLVKATSDGQ